MKQKNWLLRGLLAAAFAHTIAVCGVAHADDYDNMRVRWETRGGELDLSDPDIAAQVASSKAAAQTQWDRMIRTEGRTALWPDLSNFTNPTTITTSITRLNQLAGAYNNGNDNLRNNPEVLAAVQSGIDWLVANYYNTSAVEFGNWWEWQIGAPQALNNLVLSLYHLQTPEQRDALLAVIDRFVPDPKYRLSPNAASHTAVETGANLLDKAYIVAMRGMLGKNSAKIALARDAVSLALPYVTKGDGFYVDGSLVQHSVIPYIGGYGTVLLTNISRLYYLLGNSPWDITDPNKINAYDWALNTFRPAVHNGALMANQLGRGITRENASDHVAGRALAVSLLGLAQSLDAGQSKQIKSVVKGWMERDTTFKPNYYTGTSAQDIMALKAVRDDPLLVGAHEPVENRIYNSSDRLMLRKPDHAFVVSMFSRRISSFESGNGENLNGWWFGMGRTWLHNADQTQYSGSYWATTDMWRQAGTTTDRSGSGTPVAWKQYGNPRFGVGGAEMDKENVAAGMEFATINVTGSTLVGKKAWFLLDDKVVAVGTGITTTDGRAVETIVENRKLNQDGSNVLTVNGQQKDSAMPWQETMPSVSWAHLAGSVPGADIGYIFPDASSVVGLRERRTGRWSDVTTSGSTAEKSDNYLSLALDHGVNPTNATYTYIVVPNKSAAQMAEMAANTGISMLERSTGATAVKDTVQGVTGVVFWNDSSKTVSANGQPLITSDRKAVALLKQKGTDFKISVADPTQAYTGVVNLDINRAATEVLSADPGLTVVQMSPTIKLKLAGSGSAGKSFNAHFKLSNLSSLYPAADAFVRDGTYANNNFGTGSTITVKDDGVSYSRKGLLKFDLSSVEGVITGASLRMTPVSVGMSGITHNLYATVDANWEEAGVTWNSRPANADLVTSWTVPAAGIEVQTDVTSLAVAAQGGSKLLSFEVSAAQNYGSTGSVDYASRTHANTSQRPVLVVTVQ